MKPIPPGHCAAADNAPIPGRPWWRAESSGRVLLSNPPIYPCGSVVRTDGARLRSGGTVQDPDAEAEVEAYDAAHPLPHPGYRAGQVWLVRDRRGLATVVVAAVDTDGSVFLDAGFMRWRGAEHAGDVLADAFLLHDPLMPHLAPWGPA